MKKFLYWVINTCIIVSMIIPSGFSGSLLSTVKAATVPVATNSGMIRTTVQLKQAYDLTRLNKLDVVVLAQDGMQVDLLVTELQLESLSRLGFEPSASIDLGLLVEANQESSPWLQTALKDKIEQASVLAEENRLSNETTTEVNDLVVLDMIKSFSMEQLAGIQALPGVDNDGDGLTDTQESWWCTDPNNPDSDSDGRSDYEEIQAIKDWMANRRTTAPGETPWASWPFDPVTCPDKDYDSIPNLAERWELGLNMDMESTDRDRYDDGQEVFGVTYCPGSGNACGYGVLPSANHDGILVFPQMPAWVTFPGNHPIVSAYPKLEIDIIPDNEGNVFKIQTATVITTEKVTLEGETKLYSTTTTNGTSTSNSETESIEHFQEYSKTTELPGMLSDSSEIYSNTYNSVSQKIQTTNVNTTNTYQSFTKISQNITEVAKKTNPVMGYLQDKAFAAADFALEEACEELSCKKYAGSAVKATARTFFDVFTGSDNLQNTFQSNKCDLTGMDLKSITCRLKSVGTLWKNTYTDRLDAATQEEQEARNQASGNSVISDGTYVDIQKLFPISYPVSTFTPTETYTSGTTRGRSQTVTNTQYEEHSVTEGTEKQFSTSWGSATAEDTVHAADLWFSYQITNTGTDYAREICDLAINIYIGDEVTPAATYFPSQDIGGNGCFANFQPGESHRYTFPSGSRIQLTLDQVKAIDLGEPVRIVVEDYTLGQDDFYTSDAVNGNILLSIDDGTDDGNETVDTYLLAIFDNSTFLDAIARYFPHYVDDYGMLTAIWTPEKGSNIPSWCQEPISVNNVYWCKHSLSASDWWNVFTSDFSNGAESYQDAIVTPGSLSIIRFNQDEDGDGYSNLTEDRLGTDKTDRFDYPVPELLGGLFNSRVGDDITSNLSLLNTGTYDAFGIEAIMVAPDDSITITNNTIGGSGRVRSGKSVIVGSWILPVVTETWTGTAQPFSGGYYRGMNDRTYSFTIDCDNPGGCDVSAGDWQVHWVDSEANNGQISLGEGYLSPNLIDVGEMGLKVGFQSGRVYNNEIFSIEVHSPRDTFQYTVNSEPFTPPIVIVSYSDPQGDHQFILPAATMNLVEPGDDLSIYSGQMKKNAGIEIIAEDPFMPGMNTTSVIVNNTSDFIITDSNILLEFLDVDGNVVLETKSVVDVTQGPVIVSMDWDTADFSPAYVPENDYLVLVFWTDYEGNVLNTSGRPLSSFQADPAPEFAITPADETWDFGTAAQGTILKREFSFANTGERTLLTYVDAPEGLLVSQTGSKLIGPADMASYEITLNSSVLPVGDFSDIITIHTSDLANPTRTIAIIGSITAGEANLPALINQLPMNYTVTVPGPQSAGNWHSFTHPLGPAPQSIHPVKVYSQNYSTLYGMGKYAYEFAPGSGGFALFGDGRNGNLTVTSGQNIMLNTIRTNITGTAGSTTATVSSSAYFVAGDLVLIHQTQGTSSVGKWEYNYIVSISGTTWTFSRALSNTYNSSSGKAQVIKVPQYQNVTVQSGGTLNTPAWDGSTGGIMVFVANGVVSIAGTVTANGVGFRRGDRGAFESPVPSQGWQGESIVPGTSQTRNNNVGGGGGGNGDHNQNCGDSTCKGAGGGGGGYGTAGTNGANTASVILGGIGGTSYGSTSLTNAAHLGSGGGGGGSDDNVGKYGGYGGAGGGLVIFSGRQINITGSVTSTGNNGLSGVSANNARTGGGGGGSGGSILITGANVSLGNSLVSSLGGVGGAGSNGGGNGGTGGSGRIFVQYCDTRSGTTSPAYYDAKINCHIVEQLETSPYKTTRLQIPESFTTSKTYAIQYGRRLVFTAAGEQTTTLRLPAGYLKSAELDILISNAGVGNLTIKMDIGNNGSTDYTWTGSVNNLIARENISFTTAYNQWWSTNSGQLTGTVDVPVKITLSKAAQILLTDLKVSVYGSSLNHIQLESGFYSDVFLNIKATGTTNPLSLGIDVGNNGTIDQLITVNSPSNPHNITSNNLASQVNTYLSGHTGLVDVPIRIFLFNANQAGITNFSASIIGNKDVSLSVSDLTLPAADPMETDVVPVSATFHNSGDLPTGNFTAGFFASTPEVGEWYIGSALLPSIQPGQTASAEIMWNTAGFTGLTTVKVYADPFDHIEETSEENNLAVGEVYVRTRPDLSVTAINPSDAEPMIGELIQIAIVEKNLGETDAVTSTIALYDGNPEEEGVLIGEQNAGLIGGSETNFTFDWQPQTTGWHRLYVKSDVTNAIDEFDEANNLAWHDIYVGLAGPILLDSGTASDPVYSEEIGYGYIDIGLPDQITSCNVGNLAEDTIRRDPDGTVLYQFDHLLPGHFYHLDITLFECDGAGRQEYIFVDDNQIAGPEDLGDSQVHRLSLRLDPAFYVDRSVTIAIKADGIDGAVVSEVNLHDIDYRYADAGGGNDPQYPGEEAYGWLDGDAITTWGVLPYQSVRVDQIDSELRYRYDDLDPEKRYNVHFTFWQPSGTGRVLKVQVDGLDTGLVVNTGDYQRHQEKITIPVNAYSTDGSVVISIVRTNASSGAMVNEIALEEETVIAKTGCVAIETPYFSETYGSVMIENLNAPLGSVIQALNPRGDTVGCFTVTSEGNYGFMRIYGEDTSETPIIPGMREGEMVEYRVNGGPAVSDPLFYWSDDHAAHNINLNAGNITGQSILLNTGWNLVSFKVEPPTPLVSTVLSSIQGRYSRVLGENGIYIPSLPDEFNTLNELHAANGYYIRVTGATSVSLLIEGLAQDCSAPKQLHAGWNWIGAPCAITPTADALQSISGYYQRVLSLNKTYDPALPQYSTLTHLKPGEGYLIYVTEPVTLVYPGLLHNIGDEIPPDDYPCQDLSATPNSTLVYGQILFQGNPAPQGTVVEFLTPSGGVAGCGRIMEDGLLPLTQIYGKTDEAGETGFIEGEPISIRVQGIELIEELDSYWTDDKAPHEILVKFNVFSTYFPIILRLRE